MAQKKNLILIIVIITVIVFGMWGQHSISPTNLTDNFWTSLYQVVMLFWLSGDWTLELANVPLQIEVVRLIAPLALLASIFVVFVSSIEVYITNYLVHLYNGHTVVVGLGEKSFQFLRTCEGKNGIVVVERDPDNLLIDRTRALGVQVLIGDSSDENIFVQANLKRASELVAFTGNDGVNVELAIKAGNHVRGRKERQRHLNIHIHLNEIGLADQLERYPKFFADYSTTEISFFSVYDLSAQILLRNYPPEIFADVANQERVHLAIYGFERLAEKLMIEASRICQYANNSRLRFTIFDEKAANKELKLRSAYPYLSKICDFEFIQQSTISPHLFSREITSLLPSVTLHIICKDSDEQSLNIALMLRSSLLERKQCNAPILVRMQQSAGLAQLLEANPGEPEIPDGLYPFGMLDQILHADNILTSHFVDELARSIHQLYLDSQYAEGNLEKTALEAWNDLPAWRRKQNLLKAEHWPVKLRAIRCRPNSIRVDVPNLSPVEAELQAKMEHYRWVNNKFYDGWRYGKTRLEDAKVNPFLVPWEDMNPEQRKNEVDNIQAEPGHFAKYSNIYTQPTLVIGVSGHHFRNQEVDLDKLQRLIIEALSEIKVEFPKHHFTILSPLAQGADRLVAKLAMEFLEASLHVPLPLPYDLYQSDFPESKEEFTALVGKAEYYYEMPMKFGSNTDLALPPGSASDCNEARNRQYTLAGAYIVQRCDRLIAIYDNKPEAGTSDIGQLVRWFNEGNVDPEYSYPSRYFLPPRTGKARIIDPCFW